MKPRRAMFSSEPVVNTNVIPSRLFMREISMHSSSKINSERDIIVECRSSRISTLRLVMGSKVPKSHSDWEAIDEIEQQVQSLEKTRLFSLSQELVYRNPSLPRVRDTSAMKRRIVRRCEAAKFTSPYEKCTQMMQAGARKAEVARATVRSRQLKDFNIRLKCSCLPKKSRPPTPEPDVGVIELEPTEKYDGLQSELFPEPVVDWPYVPAAYYDTQETQVDCGHGQGMEVGDFDQEVEPYLSIIVGTAVQQAMWEVLEHNELRTDKERHRRTEAVIAGDKAELTRLENQNQRLVEEKMRRIEQFQKACRIQKEVADMMQELAAQIPEHPWVELKVLEGFRKAGYLLEDIKETVCRDAMPWIWREADGFVKSKLMSRDILDEMIEGVCSVRTVIFEILGERCMRKSPIPLSCPSSSSVSDNSIDEWEIKEVGCIESEERRKIPLSICLDDKVFEVEESLASRNLSYYSSRLQRSTILSNAFHTHDTDTLLSWSRAIEFKTDDPTQVYGNINPEQTETEKEASFTK